MNHKLKQLNFTMYKASGKLNLYIQSYWQVKKSLIMNEEYFIAPDGAMGLIINLGDSIKISTKQDIYYLKNGETILLGIHNYAILMLLQKNCHLIGVRFNPAGAFCFFRKYYDKLIQSNIKIITKNLYLNLKNNPTTISKVLNNYLSRLFKEDLKIGSFINLLKYIEEEKGVVEVNKLISIQNISRRSIDRQFKKYIGTSVNIYIRIIKIKYVRKQLRNFKFGTLTAVGYDNGYFDQSHFIKEFKTFMFKSPKIYIDEKKNLS